MPKSSFAKRTIHLDFHTSIAIPDVGADFDPDAFAQTFADAHVDQVAVFAKCHHGHLYYDTDRPERHPGLARDLDLMGEQIEALRRRGILAPVYLSVQCDEYAANTHPDWVALAPDGRQVKRAGPFEAGWQILDMSSPYQDFLAEQLDEVLRKYEPVDAVFMDMCWDQPSISVWAQRGMRTKGYDPTSAEDRAKYAHEVSHQYMARYKKMIDQAKGGSGFSVWFNGRPRLSLGEEKKFAGHVEIESLPTGGWGYSYFPYVARFVRTLNMPTLTHTGRFHTSWGDFGGLKPEAALKYECCVALSQGISCGVGDQLHPRGALDKAAYDLIGRVYGYIERCEPYVKSGKIASEAAVLVDTSRGDRPGPSGLGLVRALQETRHMFDLLSPTSDFSGYPLVVVPEMTKIDPALAKRLSAYVKKGGALLVAGPAALDANGKPAMKELGIETHGESPFTVTYLHSDASLGKDLTALDHVMYERGFRMTPAKGAKALCRVVEPYFERTYDRFCSHRQTPPDRLSRYAAVVQNGRVITFANPIFEAFAKHASVPYRRLVGACLDRLLPQPLLRDQGPAHLEASVVRKGARTIVHLLSAYPCRRTDKLDLIENWFPLVDMPLAIRCERKPRRVFAAPEERDLPFDWRDGYVHVRVTELGGHTMVVVENGDSRLFRGAQT
ncbi:MAG: alpha-L-fucosidase [Candidatus Sumerlaeota bacterium]|nr:alpha-L-fucosidase [Candidatus Sumerlaeota bacterium]